MDHTNDALHLQPAGDSVAAELLPLSIGDVFDEAFDLYKRNFALFAGIVAVMSIPMQMLIQGVNTALGVDRLAASIGSGSETADPSAVLSAAFGIMALSFVQSVVFMFVHVIQSGALTVAVSERYLGRAVTLGAAYRQAWRRIVPLLFTWVLVALVIGVVATALVFVAVMVGALFAGLMALAGPAGEVAGAVTAIVAGVVAALVAAAAFVLLGIFTTQIVMLEGVGYGRAIERNWALVRRRIPRLSFAIVLLWVVQLCLYFALSQSVAGILQLVVYPVLQVAPTVETLASTALSAVLWMLLEPFWLVSVTLMYYDQRVRREGFDLTVLEQNVRDMSSGRARR